MAAPMLSGQVNFSSLIIQVNEDEPKKKKKEWLRCYLTCSPAVSGQTEPCCWRETERASAQSGGYNSFLKDDTTLLKVKENYIFVLAFLSLIMWFVFLLFERFNQEEQ